jgi:hypothetical protein
MKTKSKTGRTIDPPIGTVDREQHYKLRELLADHSPRTYGELRRSFGFSPIFLESQIDVYPEVFQGGSQLSDGKPTIALKGGKLEDRETILCRRQLIKLVMSAGTRGIHLKNLYLATRFPSETVKLLLKEVPGIEMTKKGHSAILYRWVEPQKSGIRVSSESGQSLTVETPPKTEAVQRPGE